MTTTVYQLVCGFHQSDDQTSKALKLVVVLQEVMTMVAVSGAVVEALVLVLAVSVVEVIVEMVVETSVVEVALDEV